jgi:transcriptional regulator GlxA family with amidase domain
MGLNRIMPETANRTLTVGILIFSDVEVLDFAGPFEVFSAASRIASDASGRSVPPFHIVTIGRTGGPVRARHGLVVLPDYAIADCPALDILIVPGGVVTEPLGQADVVGWIKQLHEQVLLTASICTGAFLLAQAGLLDGLSATTHWEDIEELSANYPAVNVVSGPRFVDEGRIMSSAGVSSGIEMSLNVVADFLGEDMARRTARQMEYDFEYSPPNARTGARK